MLKRFFKRGIIESQMAWIFILIAGALILIVFYRIGSTQKQISELRIQAEISSKIRSAITSFSTGYETKSEIETVNSLIKNSCDGISVKNSRPIKLNVFSFEELNPKTSKLIVYSVPWSYPFDIDNLILLIEPETKFIIIENSKYSSVIEKIKESFPEKTNIVEVSSFQDALKEETIGKKRIILFQQEPNTNSQVDKGTYIIVINSISGKDINNFGEINFYTSELSSNKKSYEIVQEGTSYYLGFPMLLAAINSNKEIYDCNFNENLKKLYYFLSVLEERTNQIYTKLPSGSECKIPLNNAKGIITNSKSKLSEIIKNIDKNSLSNSDITDFYDLIENLRIANSELVLKTCPEIY